MSLIVLYFLHSTSVLSFYIDVVLTLSISINGWNGWNMYVGSMTLVTAKSVWYFLKAWYPFGARISYPSRWWRSDGACQECTCLKDIHKWIRFSFYGWAMSVSTHREVFLCYRDANISALPSRHVFSIRSWEKTHTHNHFNKQIALPKRVHTGYQNYDGVKTHLVTSC